MKEPHKIKQIQAIIEKYLLRTPNQPVGVRVLTETLAIGTDIGSQRGDNQDRVLFAYMLNNDGTETFSIVLCDGMGGLENGARCACLSVSSYIATLFFDNNLKRTLSEQIVFSVERANKEVFSSFGGKGGATLSSITHNTKYGYFGVNVGDSRIYTRNSENKLVQLTTDDTFAGIRKDSASYFPNDKDLLQFVGMGDDINPHMIYDINNANSFLITSDGAHLVGDEVITKILSNSKKSDTLVRRLIEVSRMYGGIDNSSIAYVQTPIDLKSQIPIDKEILYISDPYGELQIVFCDDSNSTECNSTKKELLNVQPIKNPKKGKNKPKKIPASQLEINFGERDETE